jgi:hypothetical protein
VCLQEHRLLRDREGNPALKKRLQDDVTDAQRSAAAVPWWYTGGKMGDKGG